MDTAFTKMGAQTRVLPLSARAPCQPLPARDPQEAGLAPGLFEGTLIATLDGWRRVENLRPGDRLMTLDNGPVRLLALEEMVVPLRPASPDHWPRLVPEGALGNRGALRLRPGLEIMLESAMAPAFCGDDFARLPVRALDGFRGITPVPPKSAARSLRLVLASDQVLFAEGDLLVFCPGLPAVGAPAYPVLNAAAAAGLLTLIEATEAR